MKTVGIICEYNPLHLGHAAQMAKIRAQMGEDTAIVCVMSGNFVQRGEPAVLDKFTRAEAALACGADLVLELPVNKVLSSAEGFASGGVEVLDRLGCVDYLCFGSESGDADLLLKAVSAMEREDYEEQLHEKIATGLSYAAAKQQTLEELTGERGVARTPNDILGVEYCRALRLRKSGIKPLAIKRPGSYHDLEADSENPSATAVRGLMEDASWLEYIPKSAREIFASAPQFALSHGERAVLARLRAMTEAEWEKTAHGSEGLWRKVMKAARTEKTVDGIIAASLSKRYPRTRLSRLVLCAYLGITQEDLAKGISVVRILGVSQRGRKLLRMAKNREDLPLLNAGEKPKDTALWELERRFSDLFTLFAENENHAVCALERSGRISFAEN